jgi:cytoskeletal protein CcmA (bactofilin family)
MTTPYDSTPACVIGRNIAIRGTLVGEEDLVVEGRVEGGLTLTGHLTIAEPGVVEANLDVDSTDVYGEVIGDVIAASSITIHRGARVVGNVQAPRVIIHDGAMLTGNVEMDVKLPADLAKSLHR